MRFPVVCLNLARSQDRRAKIEELWRPVLGDMLSFHEACDYKERAVPPLKLFDKASVGTVAAAACLTSHLEAMRAAKATGIGPEGVAIMEDDACPSDDADSPFDAVAASRAEFPKLDILVLTPSLFGRWNLQVTPRTAFPEDKEAATPGTHFIWYSARGIDLYLSRFSCYPTFSDQFHRLPNNGRMARCVPPPAYEAKGESTIGYAG